VAQHAREQRLVGSDQPAVERVLGFIAYAPAYEKYHQHRHQRHRQPGRRRHGISLGIGERREQLAFLRFQREYRDEGQRDDEQRKKQGRSHLARRLDHQRRMLFCIRFAMLGAIVLQLLVRVFDHHNGGVHHRTDGDGDAAQRHDVGVHPLLLHHDERDQHP